MIIGVQVSDGASETVDISLTYRAWVPGSDDWTYAGSGFAGVSPTDWTYTKPQLRAFLNATFGGATRQVMVFNGFKGDDGSVGDSGDGIYNGPSGQFRTDRSDRRRDLLDGDQPFGLKPEVLARSAHRPIPRHKHASNACGSFQGA